MSEDPQEPQEPITERPARAEVVRTILTALHKTLCYTVPDCTANEMISALMTLTGSTVSTLIENGADPDAVRYSVETILLHCGDRKVRH